MKPIFESYQDKIARLYPETNFQKHQIADISFQITDDCNLCCSYCYQIHKGKHIMPFEYAKSFIDLLLTPDQNTKKYLNSLESTAVILNFIGGEPFLQINLIDKIITYFISQCIKLNHPWQYHHIISITSNGTLYKNNEVQNFIKKWKHILSLSISIDGNKLLHDSCRIFPDGSGSYDLAISAVHDIDQKYSDYFTMGSKMTLSPQNIYYTKDAIINLINEGYQEIFANCIFEKGWNKKHAQIFYQQLKELSDYLIKNNLTNLIISLFDNRLFHPKKITDIKNWCGGNGHMIAIDWKGDIYPCIRYMESSLGNDAKPVIIGNSEKGIMNNKEYIKNAKMVQHVNRLTQSPLSCLNCSIAEGCAWCQAYNYQHSHGNINKRATYICIMHKARALANSYYWNSYYRKNNINKRFKLYLSDKEALEIINQEELIMLKNLERRI